MDGPIPVLDKSIICDVAENCVHADEFEICKLQTEKCVEYKERFPEHKPIKFGKRITVSAEYRRHWKRKPRNKVSPVGTDYKYWSILEWKQSRKGIFLGYRHLRDGYVERSYDEGNYFVMDNQIKVALVCLSPYENPIYVPLNSIS